MKLTERDILIALRDLNERVEDDVQDSDETDPRVGAILLRVLTGMVGEQIDRAELGAALNSARTAPTIVNSWKPIDEEYWTVVLGTPKTPWGTTIRLELTALDGSGERRTFVLVPGRNYLPTSHYDGDGSRFGGAIAKGEIALYPPGNDAPAEIDPDLILARVAKIGPDPIELRRLEGLLPVGSELRRRVEAARKACEPKPELKQESQGERPRAVAPWAPKRAAVP